MFHQQATPGTRRVRACGALLAVAGLMILPCAAGEQAAPPAAPPAEGAAEATPPLPAADAAPAETGDAQQLPMVEEPTPGNLAWLRLKARFSHINESSLEDIASHHEEWDEPLRRWETKGIDTPFLHWAHQTLCSVEQDETLCGLDLDWLRNIIFHELLQRVATSDETADREERAYVKERLAAEFGRLLQTGAGAENSDDLANVLDKGGALAGAELPGFMLRLLASPPRLQSVLQSARAAEPSLVGRFGALPAETLGSGSPYEQMLRQGVDFPDESCSAFFRKVLLQAAGYHGPADAPGAVAWVAHTPGLWAHFRRAVREREGVASLFRGLGEENLDSMLVHMLGIKAHGGMAVSEIRAEFSGDSAACGHLVRHAPSLYADLEDDTEARADLAAILKSILLKGGDAVDFESLQQTVADGDLARAAALAVLADAYGANAVFPWLVVTGDLQESERVQVETLRGALRTLLLQAAQADAPETGLQPLHREILGLLGRVVYKKVDSELFLSCLHRPGIAKARRLQKAVSEDIQWLRELQGRGDFPLGNLLASALEASACACGEIEQYISPASAGKQDASPARTPADSLYQTPAIRNGVETINK